MYRVAGKGYSAKPLACQWNSETSFSICGVKYMQFWEEKRKGYVSKKGIFGLENSITALTSIRVIPADTNTPRMYPLDNQVVTGTKEGDLYIWEIKEASKHYKCVSVIRCKHSHLLFSSLIYSIS